MHVDDLAYSQLIDQILVKLFCFKLTCALVRKTTLSIMYCDCITLQREKRFSDFHCFQKISDDFNFENSLKI